MKKTIAILSLIFLGTLAWAGPSHINFQGRLTDDDGQPRVGPTDVKFKVYDRETGGAPLWPLTPQDGDGIQPVTANASGLFSTIIGPFDPGFFSGNREYWLEISVKSFGFQVLKPRKQLTSVPFAFHSEKSNISLVADTVGFESIVSTSIVNGSIDGIDIKDRAIGSAKIQDNSIGNQHIRISTITAEKIDLDSLRQADLPFPHPDAIFMFLGTCPTGYDEVVELRNKYPIGADTANQDPVVEDEPGLSFGTKSHDHIIDHNHTINESWENGTEIGTGQDWAYFPDNRPRLIRGLAAFGSGDLVYLNGSFPDNSIPLTSNLMSQAASHFPPSISVMYCKRR